MDTAKLLSKFVIVSSVAAQPCHAQDAGEVRNWFDDPFVQVSADMSDCPTPLGPFLTEAEHRVQWHHRAERGTSCWLAGRCEQPNFYAYDRRIAQQLEAAARMRPALFNGTSLWITVQGRVVYLEGCATTQVLASKLESFAREVPDVQQALALLWTDRRAPPPYKIKLVP